MRSTLKNALIVLFSICYLASCATQPPAENKTFEKAAVKSEKRDLGIDTVNINLLNFVDNNQYASANRAINNLINEYAIKNDYFKNTSGGGQYELDVNSTITFENADVISVLISANTNLGGDNQIQSLEAFVIDKLTGQVIDNPLGDHRGYVFDKIHQIVRSNYQTLFYNNINREAIETNAIISIESENIIDISYMNYHLSPETNGIFSFIYTVDKQEVTQKIVQYSEPLR